MTNDLQGPVSQVDHGSDLRFWVELRGFEPLAPSMRTRCAIGLRYSPKNGCQPSKLGRLLARLSCLSQVTAAASVADSPHRSVRVLVVELVAKAGRDVDDLRRPRRLGRGDGGADRLGRHNTVGDRR